MVLIRGSRTKKAEGCEGLVDNPNQSSLRRVACEEARGPGSGERAEVWVWQGVWAWGPVCSRLCWDPENGGRQVGLRPSVTGTRPGLRGFLSQDRGVMIRPKIHNGVSCGLGFLPVPSPLATHPCEVGKLSILLIRERPLGGVNN